MVIYFIVGKPDKTTDLYLPFTNFMQ